MVTLATTPRHATTTRSTSGWNLHLGLILAAVGLNLLAGLIHSGFRASPLLVPPVVMSIPPLVFGAFAAWKGRPWMYLAAGITACLIPLLVLGVFGAWQGLLGPFALELVIATILVSVPALAIPNAILAYRAARAPAPGEGAARRRATVLYAVAIAGLLVGTAWAGAVFRAVETTSAASGGYDFTPAARAEVVTEGEQFVGPLRVKAGEITEVAVVNKDTVPHTFTYEKDGVTYNHNVPADATAKFLVLFNAPGTITYRCLPHPGMVGTLTVA